MYFQEFVLIALLIFCIVILITMLTSLWILVPYVPTPPKVVKRMIELAKISGSETVYDLGCGDARILISAKKQYPGILATGYELPIGVWILARFRVWLSGLSINICMKDFRNVNFRDADIIFLYLLPKVMSPLMKKFNEELKPGTKIISHGFPFPEKEPIHMERVPLPVWHIMRPPKRDGPRVFVYEF